MGTAESMGAIWRPAFGSSLRGSVEFGFEPGLFTSRVCQDGVRKTGLMIREEGFRSSVTEITPSLESGVPGDINHPGRHQQAGGVAQPSGWVQLGAAVVTPTVGGLFLQGPITKYFAVQGTEL